MRQIHVNHIRSHQIDLKKIFAQISAAGNDHPWTFPGHLDVVVFLLKGFLKRIVLSSWASASCFGPLGVLVLGPSSPRWEDFSRAKAGDHEAPQNLAEDPNKSVWATALALALKIPFCSPSLIFSDSVC